MGYHPEQSKLYMYYTSHLATGDGLSETAEAFEHNAQSRKLLLSSPEVCIFQFQVVCRILNSSTTSGTGNREPPLINPKP